ncbi:GNAT family N-acetyltransferase [Pseudarthrobacter sp. C4D7]|uniref:GNAT family N-acetyltransferase n=1 Tax=Pseudarthrobacter sp. C4D7 TaxID=2735268 RepID=UPI0015853486|nr:GNAT family N-acetyltransferase [Pseudarthrobacter sp. C4D7]NUT72820.1 GNAT family N-acetyltransferase [Pseudarthrobacter sp. C4D7]
MPELVPRLESLMDAAWPALERHDAGDWILRAAVGVTQRANSVWPREPGEDPEALRRSLAGARRWYRDRRLPLIFQVFDGAGYAPLNAFLDAEGFTRQSETLILSLVLAGSAADGGSGAAPTAGVEVLPHPSEEWLRVWWEVDGRGGDDALAVAGEILRGCPSLYALVRDGDGRAAAVGRLALPAGSAHGMATLPAARRRGFASAILQSLLQAGDARGVDGFWLLVTAANHGAQELYAQAGFRETGRYLYRQERPRRGLTGC